MKVSIIGLYKKYRSFFVTLDIPGGEGNDSPYCQKSNLYTVLKQIASGLDPMVNSYTLFLPSDIRKEKLRKVSIYRIPLLQNIRRWWSTKEKPNWTTGKDNKSPQVCYRLLVPATGRNQIILKLGWCWIKPTALYHPSWSLTVFFFNLMIYRKENSIGK
jgi:hypothetical protein